MEARTCPGCCTCIALPATSPDPPPPPRPGYLLTVDELRADGEHFFRPSDVFVVAVVHEPRLDHRGKLEAAWQYARAHGRPALVEALRTAATMPAGLGHPLDRVLDDLEAGRLAA